MTHDPYQTDNLSGSDENLQIEIEYNVRQKHTLWLTVSIVKCPVSLVKCLTLISSIIVSIAKDVRQFHQ